MPKNEYLILEAYENKWIGTFTKKSDAVRDLKELKKSDDQGGDYYLFKAVDIS